MTSPTGMDTSITQDRDIYLRLAPFVDWTATGQSHAKMVPHIGHLHHLCHYAVAGDVTLDEMKELSKNPKFICKICGRAAANADNLCQPDPIEGQSVATPAPAAEAPSTTETPSATEALARQRAPIG